MHWAALFLSKRSAWQTRENANDQIDHFCCPRVSRHNVGTGNASRTGSSAGRHDHASRLRMRTLQDTSSWCLRGQNHRSPDTSPLSQVCTMAWRRLRALLPLLRTGLALWIAQSRPQPFAMRGPGAKAWATPWSFCLTLRLSTQKERPLVVARQRPLLPTAEHLGDGDGTGSEAVKCRIAPLARVPNVTTGHRVCDW
jgi:hypothetical protein